MRLILFSSASEMNLEQIYILFQIFWPSQITKIQKKVLLSLLSTKPIHFNNSNIQPRIIIKHQNPNLYLELMLFLKPAVEREAWSPLLMPPGALILSTSSPVVSALSGNGVRQKVRWHVLGKEKRLYLPGTSIAWCWCSLCLECVYDSFLQGHFCYFLSDCSLPSEQPFDWRDQFLSSARLLTAASHPPRLCTPTILPLRSPCLWQEALLGAGLRPVASGTSPLVNKYTCLTMPQFPHL